MEVKFKSPYLSIGFFNKIELGNFSVITGKNGSGKTNFLKAIKEDAIEINGINRAEIVYYNYNDFIIVNNQPTHMNFQQSNDNSQWNNEFNHLIAELRRLQQEVINKLHSNGITLESILANFILQELTIKNVLEESNFHLLEKLKSKEDVLERLELFNEDFKMFISRYLQANNDLEELNIDVVKSTVQSLISQFEDYIFQHKPDWVNNVNIRLKGKSIVYLNQGDLEYPTLFLDDLAKEHKDYQLLKIQNRIDKLSAEEDGKDVPFLSKLEFEAKYGLSPITQINDILKEYDCNGYELASTNDTDFQLIAQTINPVNIYLHNKDKGYGTGFEALSSGEKTLMALALLIYKSRKNKIIPRVLLLDEIDSCLHPSMIQRLLDVIQKIFIKEYGLKVILASHSPTTIALAPDDSVYTLEKDGEDKLVRQEKQKAIDILTEGFATLNIDDGMLSITHKISTIDTPVIFTEGITDKIILEVAWKKINPKKKMPFYIQDCFDASFLGNLFKRGDDPLDGIFAKYPDKKFIALFDFDEAGYNVWNGLKGYDISDNDPFKGLTKSNKKKSAHILLLPVTQNQKIQHQVLNGLGQTFKNKSKLAIELYFYGIDKVASNFKIVSEPGDGNIVNFVGNKRSFSNTIKILSPEAFKVFEPLFEKINNLI